MQRSRDPLEKHNPPLDAECSPHGALVPAWGHLLGVIFLRFGAPSAFATDPQQQKPRSLTRVYPQMECNSRPRDTGTPHPPQPQVDQQLLSGTHKQTKPFRNRSLKLCSAGAATRLRRRYLGWNAARVALGATPWKTASQVMTDVLCTSRVPGGHNTADGECPYDYRR